MKSMMRQLSLAALLLLNATPAMTGDQQVRLLIPVLTGTELDRLGTLAPTASIVTINGKTFIELGSFKDARVAHRLGLSIQKRLRIPFDLAYDPDHPQIALALGNNPQPMPIVQVVPPAQLAPVASRPEPKPQPQPQLLPKPAPSDPIWNPLVASLNAPELETDSARGVQTVAAVKEEVQQEAVVALTATPQPAESSVEAEPPGAAVNGAVEAAANQASVAAVAAVKEEVQQDVEAEPPRAAVNGAVEAAANQASVAAIAAVKEEAQQDVEAEPPHAAVNGAVEAAASQASVAAVAAVKEEAQQPVAETTPATVAAEPALAQEAHLASAHSVRPGSARTELSRRSSRQILPKTREASAVSSSVVENATQPRQHPWLKPVKIAAVKVEAPFSRIGIAVNPQLNYIYVKIQNPSDVARLNRITPVLEVNPVGDTLIARVGVFTQSRIGRRLMKARIQKLKRQQVDLIIANGSELLEMVV